MGHMPVSFFSGWGAEPSLQGSCCQLAGSVQGSFKQARNQQREQERMASVMAERVSREWRTLLWPLGRPRNVLSEPWRCTVGQRCGESPLPCHWQLMTPTSPIKGCALCEWNATRVQGPISCSQEFMPTEKASSLAQIPFCLQYPCRISKKNGALPSTSLPSHLKFLNPPPGGPVFPESPGGGGRN